MKTFRTHGIEGIRSRVKGELVKMADFLECSVNGKPFKDILDFAENTLLYISHLWKTEEISPEINIRTSASDSPQKAVEKPYRIGFYPVAANPFHWAHLLIGLSALAEFQLDKIIFAIAGFDPRKPDLIPVTTRHIMGKNVLRIFDPLFEYSSIAAGNSFDGETNLFRFLKLNPKQRIEVFYIAGGDHYHRVNPKNNMPDTILKLEDNFLEYHRNNGNYHHVFAAFIERGANARPVQTFLPICFLPAMPFEASSTMIRETLQDNDKNEALALLPYTAYHYISKFGLYAPPSHKVEAEGISFGASFQPAFGQI